MWLTPSIALVGSGEARLSHALDCNVYLVDAPDGPVLVDTGSGEDTTRLLDNCREAVDAPVAALLTHAHADHSQGGPELQRRGIPVIASAASASLLRSASERDLGIDAAKRDDVYPPDYQFTHFEPDRTFTPATSIEAGGQPFEVIPLRGHAGDHVCYLTELDGRTACFVGDAVYPDGSISLLNVPGSSLADYRADIGNLAERDVDALLPGHGLPRLADAHEGIATAADALSGMFSPPSRT